MVVLFVYANCTKIQQNQTIFIACFHKINNSLLLLALIWTYRE